MKQSQTQIASCIGVNKSTICHELQRHGGRRGYRSKLANHLAMKWHKLDQPRIQAET